MLDVFAEVIAPVLLAAVIGGAIVRRLGIPAASISQLAFYLFSPSLVFSSMSTIELGGSETARIVATAAGGAAACVLLSWAVSTVVRHDQATRSAVALTAGMSNSGNLGLPVATLAFGDLGLDVAIIAMVTSAFMVNSLGVLVASMASGSMGGAMGSVLRVPALWAAIAGFSVNAAGLDLPAVLADSTGTLGDAAIPVMLVVLGMQLRFDTSTDALADVGIAVAIRLLAGPLIALAIATALGLDGLTRDTLVVLGGMPAAVYGTILATQYGVRPALVTRAVVVGTVVSIVTVTVLIAQVR